MSTVKAIKKTLRSQMAIIVNNVSEDIIREESRAVYEKIINDPIYVQSKNVSIYLNMGGEIQTDEIVKHSLNAGKNVFIPYFEKGAPLMMMLHLPDIETFENLKENSFKIRQFGNKHDQKQYHEFGGLDLVLVPGVAFTPTGRRLGHGMGYYDKFLHGHSKIFQRYPATFALALACQILEEVPVDEHDVKITKIICKDI